MSAKTETPARATRRSGFFAWWYGKIDASVDAQIRPAKEALLHDLPDRIIEIGPGRGSNFSDYGRGKRVLAIEPNLAFHDALGKRAAAEGVELELHGGDLRSAELRSDSADAVVSTLVLCSVGDVDTELAEIKRVLRPGGEVVFIEHVAARPGSARSYAQRVLRRPWRFLADGCDLCADTRHALDRAGFSEVGGTLERLGPAADPSTLIYWDVATK